jgi:hypothetical protein
MIEKSLFNLDRDLIEPFLGAFGPIRVVAHVRF